MKIYHDFKLPENYKGLTFEEECLNERYDVLFMFEGLQIYDTDHAIERFYERFPNLSIDRYYETFKKGLRKILDKWDFNENHYVIESRKYNIKIPVHIRPDRKNSNILLGLVATTLNTKDQPLDKYNEIKVLVENKTYWSGMIPEFDKSEGIDHHWFNHYVEEGIHYKDFEDVIVD